MIALVAAHFGDGNDAWLAGGCGIAAVLAIVGALILLPSTGNRVAMALLTTAGLLPVLSASVALAPTVAALMAAGLAAALLAIVLVGDRLPGVTKIVRQIWSATSAVSALIAVTVAFDGEVAAPVLLAMAVVIAIAGRRDDVARFVGRRFRRHRRGRSISAMHRPPRWSAPRCYRHPMRSPSWCPASC